MKPVCQLLEDIYGEAGPCEAFIVGTDGGDEFYGIASDIRLSGAAHLRLVVFDTGDVEAMYFARCRRTVQIGPNRLKWRDLMYV